MVGRKGHVGAGWREVKRRTADAAEAARERAKASDEERYEKVERFAKTQQGKGKKLVADGHRRRREATARLASTSVGAKGGAAFVKVAGRASGLPLLSLPSDFFQERSGTRALAERFKQEPDDPFLSVALAEAMARMQREMTAYTLIRTVWSPSALLVREGAKTAAALGKSQQMSAVDQLLKRAYGLSMARLAQTPGNVEALHVIARVYLGKRNPTGAVKPALLAVSRKGAVGTGATYYTLSKAYLRMSDHKQAKNYAQLAIDEGCSLGWLSLGEVAYGDPSMKSATARRTAYISSIERVVSEDVVAYAGVRPEHKAMIAYLWESQKTKSRDTATSMRKTGESAREDIGARFTAGRETWVSTKQSILLKAELEALQRQGADPAAIDAARARLDAHLEMVARSKEQRDG